MGDKAQEQSDYVVDTMKRSQAFVDWLREDVEKRGGDPDRLVPVVGGGVVPCKVETSLTDTTNCAIASQDKFAEEVNISGRAVHGDAWVDKVTIKEMFPD